MRDTSPDRHHQIKSWAAVDYVAEPRPALITSTGVRCWSCGRKIANMVTAPYDLVCQREDHGVKCGARNVDDTSSIIAYSQ